jgi:hypothetical protein
MFFVLKFELILIIGSSNVLTEGARKVYRGRRVGQGCSRQCGVLENSQPYRPLRPVTGTASLYFFYLLLSPLRTKYSPTPWIYVRFHVPQGGVWAMR